jgi:hypothetical protein
LRLGWKYTGREPASVIAWFSDLWQLRSTTTISSVPTAGLDDDAVGRRRSRQDVEGPVGAENSRGHALRFGGRSFDVEPGAALGIRDAEVGAHDVLTEESGGIRRTAGCLR